jgi:hypothetical protein
MYAYRGTPHLHDIASRVSYDCKNKRLLYLQSAVMQWFLEPHKINVLSFKYISSGVTDNGDKTVFTMWYGQNFVCDLGMSSFKQLKRQLHSCTSIYESHFRHQNNTTAEALLHDGFYRLQQGVPYFTKWYRSKRLCVIYFAPARSTWPSLLLFS